jgi:hypothetical protein
MIRRAGETADLHAISCGNVPTSRGHPDKDDTIVVFAFGFFHFCRQYSYPLITLHVRTVLRIYLLKVLVRFVKRPSLFKGIGP